MLGHPKEPLRDNRIIPTHHTLCAKLYGCNHHMGSSAFSHTRLAACAARGTSGATVAPPSKKYYTRHYLNWHARAHVHRDTIRKHPAYRHSVHRLLAECTPREEALGEVTGKEFFGKDPSIGELYPCSTLHPRLTTCQRPRRAL